MRFEIKILLLIADRPYSVKELSDSINMSCVSCRTAVKKFIAGGFAQEIQKSKFLITQLGRELFNITGRE
jgi:hypothetical protein